MITLYYTVHQCILHIIYIYMIYDKYIEGLHSIVFKGVSLNIGWAHYRNMTRSLFTLHEGPTINTLCYINTVRKYTINNASYVLGLRGQCRGPQQHHGSRPDEPHDGRSAPGSSVGGVPPGDGCETQQVSVARCVSPCGPLRCRHVTQWKLKKNSTHFSNLLTY